MLNRDVDILIVGGGLVGATLLRALMGSPYRVLLVDAEPVQARIGQDFDARSLALSKASLTLLKTLGAWPQMSAYATPIKTIHISERGRFGRALLKAPEATELGAVLEMQHLNHGLWQTPMFEHLLAPATVTALDPSQGLAEIQTPQGMLKVSAKLIVAADGASSSIRTYCGLRAQELSFGQHALIANIGLARAHQSIAYERFGASGPLAMLPMQDHRAALVWAQPPEEAARLLAVSDDVFLTALQKNFGYRLGRLLRVGQRATYPLRQVVMPQQIHERVVFIGNAAHTLHPIAGQGFNLGIRDVASLAQHMVSQGLNPDMLKAYQKARQHDQAVITRFTQGLIRGFGLQWPAAGMLRGLGLLAFDQLPFLQQILSRYASGYGGVTPDLVCGIPLEMEPYHGA